MTGGDSTDAAVSRPSRRALLAALGTGAVGGLAGCALGSDGGSTPPTDAPTATGTSAATTPTRTPVSEEPTPSPAPTATPTPTQTSTDTPASTPPAGSLDPAAWGPPDEGDWERTFADFFDGGSLDTDNWQVGIEGHHDGTHCSDAGARRFCWAPDHVSVDAATNRLRLRVSGTAPPLEERAPEGADAGYTVGAVNTRGRFAQEFGYFEAAVRIPDQPGTLPAFWLFLDKFDHDWREIDVYEKNGSHDARTLKLGAYVEKDDDGPDPPAVEVDDNDDRVHLTPTADGTARTGSPVDERFHVVGCEWAPEYIAWDVDGTRVGRIDDPAVAEYFPGEELFVVINSAVFEGADWLGSPADARFPHYQEVEWVRVWQRDDWT